MNPLLKKQFLFIALLLNIASICFGYVAAMDKENKIEQKKNDDKHGPFFYKKIDAGGSYFQMKIALDFNKDMKRIACGPTAIWITNTLLTLLEKSPEISNDDIFNALNNRDTFLKEISKIGTFLETRESYYREAEAFKVLLNEANEASNELIADGICTEKDRYTKRIMPSGLFIKDVLTKLLNQDPSTVIVYFDGLNAEKDEVVSICFGKKNKTKKNLLEHKKTFKKIIDSVKKTTNDYRIFVFSADVVKAFTHWIVLLVRNVGENKVETILLDPYVFNTFLENGKCTYSETDQTKFPGWLYQNFIQKKTDFIKPTS